MQNSDKVVLRSEYFRHANHEHSRGTAFKNHQVRAYSHSVTGLQQYGIPYQMKAGKCPFQKFYKSTGLAWAFLSRPTNKHSQIGRIFCRDLYVESKQRTSASFCCLSSIDIFQYVAQNSTCLRQNTLYFIILELITMYTLVSDVHVCINVI